MSELRLHHVGVWVGDLEQVREFYVSVLGGASGPLYENPQTGFSSYFISFSRGARIELMSRGSSGVDVAAAGGAGATGLAHVALAVGSREAVDRAVEHLRGHGVTIVGDPRVTGDGYYEAVVEDPEGNRIELVESADDPAGLTG